MADGSGAVRIKHEEGGEGHLGKKREEAPMGIDVKCGDLDNTRECQQAAPPRKHSTAKDTERFGQLAG